MVSLFWKAYFHNISETQRETTLTPVNTVNTSVGKPQKAAPREGDFSELRDLDEATQTTKLGFLMWDTMVLISRGLHGTNKIYYVPCLAHSSPFVIWVGSPGGWLAWWGDHWIFGTKFKGMLEALREDLSSRSLCFEDSWRTLSWWMWRPFTFRG